MKNKFEFSTPQIRNGGDARNHFIVVSEKKRLLNEKNGGTEKKLPPLPTGSRGIKRV